MKKYTVLGSCQAEGLVRLLSTNPSFTSQYQYQPIKAIWQITEDEIPGVHAMLKTIDLFIYQPIMNYGFLMTTQYITEKDLKPDCLKLIFRYFYFAVYHSQIMSIITKFGRALTGFCDYHDFN